MSIFHANEVLPGVYHIQDPMGVCMTLLAGSRKALLVDTGYGLEDVQAFVRTLTDLPVQVVLTHAHHDHAAGAVWFDRVFLCEADLPHYALYTDQAHRERVQQQAQSNGIAAPEGYASMPAAEALPLESCEIDLGGLKAQVIACPGHTPGSAVIYVPQYELLLTGDDWNPCTWLFFEQALPVEQYRANMLEIQKLPFEHVLCSHQPKLFERSALDAFLKGLTDEALMKAHPVDMGRSIDTREIYPAPGMNFVFDWGKSALSDKERAK